MRASTLQVSPYNANAHLLRLAQAHELQHQHILVALERLNFIAQPAIVAQLQREGGKNAAAGVSPVLQVSNQHSTLLLLLLLLACNSS